jgi:hypothetical protein
MTEQQDTPKGRRRTAEEIRTAAFWRRRVLGVPGAAFQPSAHAQLIYGSVLLGAHRLGTPIELLRYVIAFANGRENRLPIGAIAFPPDDEKLAAVLPELEPERLEARRKEMRALLGAASRGAAEFVKPPQQLLDATVKHAGRIDWAVSLERGTGWRVLGTLSDPDTLVAVVTGMLLHEKVRQMIGLCGHPACEREPIFIVQRGTGGRARELYCSDACMMAANVQQAARRQRDLYKRNKATDMLVGEGRAPTRDAAKEAVRQVFKADPDATAEELANKAKALLQSARKHR